MRRFQRTPLGLVQVVRHGQRQCRRAGSSSALDKGSWQAAQSSTGTLGLTGGTPPKWTYAWHLPIEHAQAHTVRVRAQDKWGNIGLQAFRVSVDNAATAGTHVYSPLVTRGSSAIPAKQKRIHLPLVMRGQRHI